VEIALPLGHSRPKQVLTGRWATMTRMLCPSLSEE
jgi:hypothetical protein